MSLPAQYKNLFDIFSFHRTYNSNDDRNDFTVCEKILVFYHNDFEQMPICMPSKEQNKEKDSIIHTKLFRRSNYSYQSY